MWKPIILHIQSNKKFCSSFFYDGLETSIVQFYKGCVYRICFACCTHVFTTNIQMATSNTMYCRVSFTISLLFHRLFASRFEISIYAYDVQSYNLYTNIHATQHNRRSFNVIHWLCHFCIAILILNHSLSLSLSFVAVLIATSWRWTSLVNDTAKHCYASACMRDIYVICILI